MASARSALPPVLTDSTLAAPWRMCEQVTKYARDTNCFWRRSLRQTTTRFRLGRPDHVRSVVIVRSGRDRSEIQSEVEERRHIHREAEPVLGVREQQEVQEEAAGDPVSRHLHPRRQPGFTRGQRALGKNFLIPEALPREKSFSSGSWLMGPCTGRSSSSGLWCDACCTGLGL